MKILIFDTYYPKFLKRHGYDDFGQSYDELLSGLLKQSFGTGDAYSHYLKKEGFEALDVVGNSELLQKKWAEENKFNSNKLFNINQKINKIPYIGNIAHYSFLDQVLFAQVEKEKPDIFYCQDITFFSEKSLSRLKKSVRLLVGQIASPLPRKSIVRKYDLIMTSFPHFVNRLRNHGIVAEYLKIGFDERILDKLGNISKTEEFSFVGGIGRHHSHSISLLEHLCRDRRFSVFGYGVDALPKSSPIRRRHKGEVWGLDMYKALASSRISINRHINCAENFANNMRLFETTGVGSMLLTDYKSNLADLFDIGSEIMSYRTKEEALELAQYYTDKPHEAAEIARAGQRRTLQEHTYRHRISELCSILRKYI